MPRSQGGGFRRVLFHGPSVGERFLSLADERIESRSVASAPRAVGPDEVAIVVCDSTLADKLAGPPARQLGEGADRIAVVLVGDDSRELDPFWSARTYVSLPETASEKHLARAIASLFRVLEDRALSARARASLADRTAEIQALVDVGVALSAERDRDQLLETILSRARALTHADAGSLYLIEPAPQGEDVLKFVRAQNDSVQFEFVERSLPLDKTSIAGFVAVSGETLNLLDVRQLPVDAPYRFDDAFDRTYGYRSRSMLAVPMKTPQGRTIGVLQLLNRIQRVVPDVGITAVMKVETVAFDEKNERLAHSLSAQAAVAVENRLLNESIRRLFEGFVEASVTAIEQRDPTTSGHSQRVAVFSCELAELADRSEAKPFASFHLTREELRELRYAAVLHDFGKVGVREWILVKARKLPPGRRDLLRSRIEQAILSAAAETWEMAAKERWTERQVAQVLGERVGRLERAWKAISRADEPALISTEVSEEIERLKEIQFRDASGALRPLVEPEEIRFLSVPQGSLTDRERREIESHVTQTFRFLSKIPWTPDLARVPEWAYAHHEKLDGSGYPRGLTASQLPLPVRAVTISDIYDALAARDRPYKKAVACERALDILRSEARRGVIDSDLLDLFIEGKVFTAASQRRKT